MAKGNTMSLENEIDIVKMAQNGDSEAITTIINEYKLIVKAKSRAFYLVGGEQEDLLQEGLIGVMNAIKNFDESKGIKFSTFANLCVTRQMITAIKMANRDKNNILNNAFSLNKISHTVNDEEYELLDIIVDNSTLSPEDIFISNEGVDGIMKTIDKTLSAFEKEVLTYYLDGESYVDIGLRFDKDKKAIDNALQRIRKKLDKAID